MHYSAEHNSIQQVGVWTNQVEFNQDLNLISSINLQIRPKIPLSREPTKIGPSKISGNKVQ